MNRSLLSFLFVTASTSVAAIGCAAESSSKGDGVNVDDITSAQVVAGTFKLYDEPGANPDPSCDRYKKLVIAGNTATIENVLEGTCELMVTPDKRTFQLRAEDDGCGSLIYTGLSDEHPTIRRHIEITDHRARLCENVVPARVVVKVSDVSFTGVQDRAPLYSLDGAAER